MTSPEKAAANAANAQRSSGPVSAEGKTRSSQNAIRHGLTARKPFIPPERREEFDLLEAALNEECSPQGRLELNAFDQLVFAAWKQQCVRELEGNLLAEGAEALFDETKAKALDRLQRYGAAADRAYTKALKELRALQTERTLRGTIADEIATLIPTLASLPAVTKQQAANRKAVVISDREIEEIINAPMPTRFPGARIPNPRPPMPRNGWVRFVNGTAAGPERGTRGNFDF
jgi:hypothetical protein